MLSWLIQVKPFDAHYKNYLETFNKFIILSLSYIDFLFTDFVEDPTTRYSFGYFYISIIAFGLLVNVITMGTASLIDLVRACRRRKNTQKTAVVS